MQSVERTGASTESGAGLLAKDGTTEALGGIRTMQIDGTIGETMVLRIGGGHRVRTERARAARTAKQERTKEARMEKGKQLGKELGSALARTKGQEKAGRTPKAMEREGGDRLSSPVSSFLALFSSEQVCFQSAVAHDALIDDLDVSFLVRPLPCVLRCPRFDLGENFSAVLAAFWSLPSSVVRCALFLLTSCAAKDGDAG